MFSNPLLWINRKLAFFTITTKFNPHICIASAVFTLLNHPSPITHHLYHDNVLSSAELLQLFSFSFHYNIFSVPYFQAFLVIICEE